MGGCRGGAKEAFPPGTGEIKVAAASDLVFAFEELAAVFQRSTGKKVTLLFGSSGRYARQLAEGAPFDVFASADLGFVEDVISAGVCDRSTQAIYARGRLVLWTRIGTAPAKELSDLTQPRFQHVALADPEHAPYGRASLQALESAGLWPRLKSKVVYGDNIQQTHELVRSGRAEVAIVAQSLALHTRGGVAVPIDERAHPALEQGIVACTRGGDAVLGRQFVSFVGSPEGRAILARHGFGDGNDGNPGVGDGGP